jgi:5-methylcytosine-specific restriction endonuclease McrA
LNRHRLELMKCYGAMCFTHNGDGCGRVFEYISALTVDHIVPKCFGGNGDIINKQLLCKDCHARKTKWYNSVLGVRKQEVFLGHESITKSNVQLPSYES